MSRFRLLPIVLWFGVAVVLNVIAPVSLGDLLTDPRPLVPATDAATLAPIGQAFPGTGTDNTVNVVVDSYTVNSDEVRAYLDTLKNRLEANAGAVGAVLDMSADSLTAPVTQSVDRRTTYLPVWLRGELGSEEGLASLTAVQTMADDMPRPAGLRLSWSGPAAEAKAQLTASTHLSPWLVLAVLIGCILLVVLAARPAKAAVAVLLSSLGTLAIVFPLRELWSPALAGNSTAATAALVVALTVGATFGCTQMLLSRYRYRRLGDDTAFTRSYWAAAAPVFGAATVAASTLMAFGFCALPRIDASGLWAGVSVLVCALVVLTTAPCYLDNVSGVQLPHNTFAATMSLRLRKPVYRHPQETLAVVAVVIVACGFQLVGLQPSVVEPEPNRAVNAANTSASQGFSGARMSPETVVITARKDLRTPVGLLAINEVTRQLMALPGVHLVQSGSWPGGLPWPDATLAHQIGEFNRQLQSGALSASPLTSSVARLPDDMRQIVSSLDRLERIVDGLVDGLSRVNGSLEGLHPGIAGLTETIAVLSRYADPVRRWVGSYANCAADPFCSIGLKITEAVDSVVADTAQLTASSREVSDAAAGTIAIVSSFRTVITQMRPAIADMGELINGLASAVTDLVPEVTRSTSFINLMTNDLSIADAGGFYLSQDRIDAESYSHARETLFSADGRSTRLFVFTDAESAGVSGPDLAIAIRSAVTQTTKYGPLADSAIHVTGVRTMAKPAQDQWSGDLWRALGISALAMALIAGICLRSIRAGLAVAASSALSFACGTGIFAFLCTHVFGTSMNWAVPALGGGVAMAVVAFDAVGVSARALARVRRDTRHLSLRPGGTALVCAVMVWAGVAGLSALVQPSVLGQVGAVAAITLAAGYVISRVGLLSALAFERQPGASRVRPVVGAPA